jgi:uncharacterized membrane protein
MKRPLFLALAGLFLGPSLLPAAEAASGEAAGFDWRAFLAPFHTVTLHLPIGFVMMAAILEGYNFLRPSRELRKAIGVVVLFSAATAVLVAFLGILRADGGGYDPGALDLHRWFGIAVGVATVLLAVVHPFAFREGCGPLHAVGYRALLAIDLVLLAVAGHGGGNLTHGSKYLTANAPPWVRQWLEGDGKVAPGEEGGGGYYAEKIRPLFEAKCFSCHGPEKQSGDYRMDTVAGLLAPGESGLDPIVAGRPLESYLVELITLPGDDDLAMPPDGKVRLSPEETLEVIRWIWNGAKTDA